MNRGYIIVAEGNDLVSCKEETEAIWMVLSLRKEGYTANMRRDGSKEFIPISDLTPTRGRHENIIT